LHAETHCADSQARRTRQEGFTAVELVRLLDEARNASKPVIRVATLIHVYHGARLSEIVEASTRDFEWVGDELVMHIRLDHRPERQRVKTDYSLRRFPLHRVIVVDVRAYLGFDISGSFVSADQNG
jgi:hypothetical protein